MSLKVLSTIGSGSLEANCTLAIHALTEAKRYSSEVAVVFAPFDDLEVVWILFSEFAGKDFAKSPTPNINRFESELKRRHTSAYFHLWSPEQFKHPVVVANLTLIQQLCAEHFLLEVKGRGASRQVLLTDCREVLEQWEVAV